MGPFLAFGQKKEPKKIPSFILQSKINDTHKGPPLCPKMPQIGQKDVHFQTNSVTQIELKTAQNDGIFLRSKKRPSRSPFGLRRGPPEGVLKAPKGGAQPSCARIYFSLTRNKKLRFLFLLRKNKSCITSSFLKRRRGL